MDIVEEFVNGLKKPFQTEEERKENTASAVGSYAALLALFVVLRG